MHSIVLRSTCQMSNNACLLHLDQLISPRRYYNYRMAADKGKAGPSRPTINRPLPASVPKLAQEAVTVLPIIEAEKRAAASATGTTGSSSNTNGNANAGSTGRFRARYQAFQGTRAFKGFSFVKKYRRSFLFGAFVIYTSYSYTAAALHARKRDKIRDSTYLYWKIYDGSIVEAKSSTTVLNSLLFSGGTGGSDEPARVMTIFDVVRTLNWAMRDDRIVCYIILRPLCFWWY